MVTITAAMFAWRQLEQVFFILGSACPRGMRNPNAASRGGK